MAKREFQQKEQMASKPNTEFGIHSDQSWLREFLVGSIIFTLPPVKKFYTLVQLRELQCHTQRILLVRYVLFFALPPKYLFDLLFCISHYRRVQYLLSSFLIDQAVISLTWRKNVQMLYPSLKMLDIHINTECWLVWWMLSLPMSHNQIKHALQH